jgi:hypothetical protein
VLAVLFVPQIMIGLLPDHTADLIHSSTPMPAGLSVQQTALADSVPIGRLGRRGRGSCRPLDDLA